MAGLKQDILNLEGKKVGSTSLAESVFAIDPNVHVMHQVVRAQMAEARQGTHATKTRGQVRGGGRKPYRQKGTGRARQGTIRAPQYRGGGVVFGPHPKSYAIKVNRQEVKLALRSALSAKLADQTLKILDNVEFEKPSTKAAIAALKALDIKDRVTLVVDDEDVNAFLSFRNIPIVRIIPVAEMNTYDFIDNKMLVLTKAALSRVEEVLG
ncbi:MAG: 50S ribosomal protein L4 [Coriobacteriales bacterium]|jgi:large subunit ribosomal protein L4|nr:50S ribosomal protein L4 [Coriobacteriales bacterium]